MHKECDVIENCTLRVQASKVAVCVFQKNPQISVMDHLKCQREAETGP